MAIFVSISAQSVELVKYIERDERAIDSWSKKNDEMKPLLMSIYAHCVFSY